MYKKNISAILLSGVMLSGLSANALTPKQTNDIVVSTSLISLQTSLNKENISLSGDSTNYVYFASIDRLVRENNESIKSFKKTLASVLGTDTSAQFKDQIASYEIQNASLSQQAAGYQASADELFKAAENSKDETTKAALEAQANAMALLAQQAKMNIAVNEGIISGLEDSQEDTQHQIEDTYTATKKQLDNAADQIVIGAETQYITLVTIDNNINTLNRSIAAVDRSIDVMKVQLEIGMASEMDLKTLENQRQTLESNLETLKSQQKTLQQSLSLTLGNEVGTYVEARTLPYMNNYRLQSINYDEDLEQAMDNSYAIWQKWDTARKASNDYEDNITSTADAYQAAKIDLEATKEQTENSFKALYDTLLEKQRLFEQAKENLEFAEENFKVVEVKYNMGNISTLEYENEKDTVESAKDAVTTAEVDFFTAYNNYQWGIKGVI